MSHGISVYQHQSIAFVVCHFVFDLSNHDTPIGNQIFSIFLAATNPYVHKYMCIYMYIYMYVNEYIYIYIRKWIYIYILCKWICMYIYMIYIYDIYIYMIYIYDIYIWYIYDIYMIYIYMIYIWYIYMIYIYISYMIYIYISYICIWYIYIYCEGPWPWSFQGFILGAGNVGPVSVMVPSRACHNINTTGSHNIYL